MNKIKSINPSTSQVINEVEVSTPDDIKAEVGLARKASKSWRDIGVSERAKQMREVASKFEASKEKLASLQAEEMGMPIKEAVEDIEFGLEYLNSYCDTAEKHLQSEVTSENDAELHEVFREPFGVAACIVPWNFPFANWVWQCGQNLVAGNTVVFKHSEETPLCGKLIEEIVNSVLPEGVFNEVYGDGSVGEMLVNEDVNLICFTGSTKTGAKINEIAASRFIPTIMELGGSAPGIVFEDADIDSVIDTIYTARFMNCGQMCDGLKRLIVQESKFDEVVAKLEKLLTTKQLGDASNEKTDIGPLVAERQAVLLEEQVADAVQNGAKIVTGGKRPNEPQGAYYQPTILTNVSADMRVWQEEVFGPVLPIMSFKTEEEAVELANNTIYGLGAYVFTKDKTRFDKVSRQLQSGMVSQNNVSYINVCNPFTGYKMSGGGKEHGKYGFEEVTRVKVIAREK